MAQHLALARTRTQVVQVGAQCTDHWTTGQSHGVCVPMVQLTTHVKSSTLYSHTVVRLYGRTSKFFQLDGLLLFCIIMGLCSASSAINCLHVAIWRLVWVMKKARPFELNWLIVNSRLKIC